MSEVFWVDLSFDNSSVNKVAVGNAQDRGQRDYQEDSFGFSSLDSGFVRTNGFISVIADGMGGLEGGDKVSEYTVSALLKMVNEGIYRPPHIRFSETVNDINNYIASGDIAGGCTVAAVLCMSKGIFWCSVGDSRIYLFRNGGLHQLSEDSDYINKLLDKVIKGRMSLDDAFADPEKDSLASYIGYKGHLKPDVNLRPLIPATDDKILICSDGVYNALTEGELSEALRLQAHEAADEISRRITDKGYTNQDNYTATVLEFV